MKGVFPPKNTAMGRQSLYPPWAQKEFLDSLDTNGGFPPKNTSMDRHGECPLWVQKHSLVRWVLTGYFPKKYCHELFRYFHEQLISVYWPRRKCIVSNQLVFFCVLIAAFSVEVSGVLEGMREGLGEEKVARGRRKRSGQIWCRFPEVGLVWRASLWVGRSIMVFARFAFSAG
jgi:hypothetical protein